MTKPLIHVDFSPLLDAVDQVKSELAQVQWQAIHEALDIALAGFLLEHPHKTPSLTSILTVIEWVNTKAKG